MGCKHEIGRAVALGRKDPSIYVLTKVIMHSGVRAAKVTEHNRIFQCPSSIGRIPLRAAGA